MIKELAARSMYQMGLSPFVVSGGIFSGETHMGWQIVDENGHTLAIACDSSFCEGINALVGLALVLKRVDAYYHLSEAHDDGQLDCSDEEWATIKKLFSACAPKGA